MSEEIQFAIQFSLIGILVVFASLAIISVSVSLMRWADSSWEKREAREKEEATTKSPSIDDLTMVLISAAVGTMIQGRFHIRKVRRLMPTTAVAGSWSVHGRAILHGSHVVPKKR